MWLLRDRVVRKKKTRITPFDGASETLTSGLENGSLQAFTVILIGLVKVKAC